MKGEDVSGLLLSIMIKHLLWFFIFILLSCGKEAREDSEEEIRESNISNDGTYSARLVSVNGRISNEIYGDVRIHKFGDEFQVNVRVRNAPRGARFRQYLHTGSFCPKMNQDTNADGYIDAYEARSQAGHIIVPFDDDLSSQLAGGDLLLQGNYNYTKSTSYHLMLSDLHRTDDITNDAMVKLTDRDLPLERKTVLIYIVGRSFPSTVTGSEVPVACGILTRISEYPQPPDDEYQTDTDGTERRPTPRPRPRPRPRPQPDNNEDTSTTPAPEEPQRPRTWWERVIDWWLRRTGG